MDMDAHSTLPRQEGEHNVYHLTWTIFDALTRTLTQQISTSCPHIDIIIGLQRGGLIPAVTLSHRLGVPTLFSFPIRRTTSDAIYASKHAPITGSIDAQHVAGKTVLVVDDIVGSGSTLQAALHQLHQYHPANVQSVAYFVNRRHWDQANTATPSENITYIGEELAGWVIFPWEKPLASSLQTPATSTIAL